VVEIVVAANHFEVDEGEDFLVEEAMKEISDVRREAATGTFLDELPDQIFPRHRLRCYRLLPPLPRVKVVAPTFIEAVAWILLGQLVKNSSHNYSNRFTNHTYLHHRRPHPLYFNIRSSSSTFIIISSSSTTTISTMKKS
jgi:hypothetical protein